MKLAWVALALTAGLGILAPVALRVRPDRAGSQPPTNRCEGGVAPGPDTRMIHLRNGAFPGSDHPDVAVHIPPGFDATRQPGLVLYFHGWQGCVAAAVSAQDVPCDDDASGLHIAADLANQVDAARVNALLVAVELRFDQATGEPGRLAIPAGARELLRELFAEHLSAWLGCPLDVDALDRIVIIAHSGGYQAAAGVLVAGDLPQVGEVILLDALYGAEDIFRRWIADDIRRFDTRAAAPLRFVDLYTCCGGTTALSQTLADMVRLDLERANLADALHDDDVDDDPPPSSFAVPVVFQRVRDAHGDLPRLYVRRLLEASAFANVSPLVPIAVRPVTAR